MHDDPAKPATEVEAAALIAAFFGLLVHRPRQKRSRTQVELTCQGTIDQEILAALRARQDVIDSSMQPVAKNAKDKER